MDEDLREPEDGGASARCSFDEQPVYSRPRPLAQVWLILGVVFVAVVIAVVAVYQQGHDKPTFTRQALQPSQALQPTATAFAPTGLGARNCPSGGAGATCPGGQGCPAGGGAGCPAGGAGCGAAQLAAFGLPAPSTAPPAAQPAVCPRCNGQALPLCDRCNAIMLPLANGLFYCPQCGVVGTPLCPYCSARMTTGTSRLAPAPMAMPTAAVGASPAGGQFVCPTCNTTGLPNWTASGAPVCPNCGSPMGLRGARP